MPSPKDSPQAKKAIKDLESHPGHNARGEDREELPVSKSESALASSAHSRINIPINTHVWEHLPEKDQELLTWWHTVLLKDGLDWDQACDTIGYDRTTVFRVLKGTYPSWPNVLKKIKGYRKLYQERSSIQQQAFAENSISRLIWGGLDYALAANGITEIVGESGQGKTCCTVEWQSRNNHGKSVYAECPAVGGIRSLLREICGVIGANKNQSIVLMRDSIIRALNPNRILIIDEASRLLPSEKATPPRNLDLLREIHDKTGCGLALITTARFGKTLRDNEWMYEQLLGRIDMPIRLPREMDDQAYMPLLTQYIEEPSQKLHDLCKDIVNTPLGGRMRRLSKVLKFATRIATKDKQPFGEPHIIKSWQYHCQMSGESYARPAKR